MRVALRSVGAVLAGLVAAGATVMLLTAAAVLLFFDGDFSAPPTGPYVTVNLAYTFGAGALGGWVTARLAARSEVIHGVALAALMVVLTLVGGTGGGAVGVPAWYDTAVMVLGPLGVLGGALAVALKPDPYEPVDLPT